MQKLGQLKGLRKVGKKNTVVIQMRKEWKLKVFSNSSFGNMQEGI